MTSQGKSCEATSARKRRSGVVSMGMTDDPKRFLTVIHEDLEDERSRPSSPSVKSLARTEEKAERKDRDEEGEERKPRTTRSYSSCRLFSPTTLTLPGGRNLDLSPTGFDFGKDGGFGLGFEFFPELSEAIRTKILGNEESADDTNDDDYDDDRESVTMRRHGSTVTANSVGDKPFLSSSGRAGDQDGSVKVTDYMRVLKSQRVLTKPKADVETPDSPQSITQVDESSRSRSPVPSPIPAAEALGRKKERKGLGQSGGEQQAEDKDEVLGKLKETATKLNLPTRRPSYLAWRERYLNPLTAASASPKVSSGGLVPGIPLLKHLHPPPSNGRSPPLARSTASSSCSVSQRQPVKAPRKEESDVPSSRNPQQKKEECTSSPSPSQAKQRTLLHVQNVSSEVSSDPCTRGTSGCSAHYAGKQTKQEPQTYTASVTLHLQRGDLQKCSLKQNTSSGPDSQLNSTGSRSLLNSTMYCLCGSEQTMVVARTDPLLPEDDRIDETTTTKSSSEESTLGAHARDSAYNSDDEGEPSPLSSKEFSQANNNASSGLCPDQETQCRTDGSSREEAEESQNEAPQPCTDVREEAEPQTQPKSQCSGRVPENLKNDSEAVGRCREETCVKCGKLIQREIKAAAGKDQGQSSIPESDETHPPKDGNRHFLVSKKDSLTREKRREIDGKLEWIKSELMGLRRMDQSLARQLLNIHHDLCRMRLVFSCQEHRELLEDMTLDLAEVETLKRYLEYPSGALSFNPLRHIGVTKMNLVSRRFSTC